MLLDSGNALDRVRQAELLLAGEVRQGNSSQIFIEDGSNALINDGRFIVRGEVGIGRLHLLPRFVLQALRLSATY